MTINKLYSIKNKRVYSFYSHTQKKHIDTCIMHSEIDCIIAVSDPPQRVMISLWFLSSRIEYLSTFPLLYSPLTVVAMKYFSLYSNKTPNCKEVIINCMIWRVYRAAIDKELILPSYKSINILIEIFSNDLWICNIKFIRSGNPWL